MWLLQKVFKSDVKANLVIKRNTRDGEQELQEKMSSMITIVKLVYSQSTDMMECFHTLRPPEQFDPSRILSQWSLAEVAAAVTRGGGREDRGGGEEARDGGCLSLVID
nr:unnamed protein product [Brassica rapa]